MLRLGHIDDPPRRHYSAFVKPQAMREQKRRDLITEAVLDNVSGAFAEIRGRGDRHLGTEIPIGIWYIASDGNAAMLADIVRDDLAAKGFQIGGVSPVPR